MELSEISVRNHVHDIVRPKLQYACSAWDPHYQKDKAALERVQRKAVRFVTGNYDRTASVTAMIPDRERKTRGSHDFKFIVPKGHKDILRFFFS